MKFDYNFFNLTLDHLPDPIFIKDQQHRWVYGNRAFSKLLGMSLEQYQGKSDYDLYPDAMAKVFWEKDDLVFKTALENENEESILDAQGETRYLLTKKVIIHAEDGEPFLLGVIRDITERRSTESKLAFSAKFASIGQLLGSIAHEINTPLMVILACVDAQKEILARETFDKKLLEVPTRKIEKTTERITKIIRSLKNMVRDTEHDPWTLQPLHAIIQDAIDLCSEKLQRNSVELEFEYNEEIRINCNAVEISQVFLNIIQNAIDAIRDQKIRKITIQAYKKDKYACIDITDTGPEIPKNIRTKLMTPFFSTKPAGEGTGVGLSLALAIMKRHKGAVTLLPEKQTCFRITLPFEAS